MAYLWKGIPFVCYFVLPSMKGIDPALYEAAYSMGATKWKSFFRITLPICLPAILGALFILLSYNFGAYELPFLLGATSPKALPVQAYIEYTHPDLLHRPVRYGDECSDAAHIVGICRFVVEVLFLCL